MPLSRKIDKTTFDSLNDVIKAEYTEKNGSYFLNVDDADALQRALDNERNEKNTLKTDLQAMRDELAAIRSEADNAKAEKNRKTRDYDALEADFNRKLDEAKTVAKANEDKLKVSIQTMLVDNKALEIANKLGGENADILIPHIKSRLQADFDGDTPATRVLDKNGQVSANSLADLEKEFVDNPRFAPILVGSRASGGSATGNAANGSAGNKKPHEMTTAERTHLYNTNPTEFARLFPQSAA